VVERQWVTPGASSIYSTTRDMSRYIGALLGGGSNRHGMVLKPETLGTMYQAQYQPHPLIPGMGLGFERGDAAGHVVVGHGGILPGFNSQLFVAPEDGVGVFAVTNGAAVAMLWLPTELSRVLNRLLDVPDAVIRTDVPHHPEIWPRITGWYELPGRLTDIRARMMVGAGVQVRVEGGRPILRILTPIPGLMRGLPLHPDDPTDPYVFRIDLAEFGLPAARIVFGRGPGGVATAVHLDIFPVSLRRPFATRPSLGVRGRVALSVGLSLVASLAATAVARRLRGRRRMQG
jgi:hypothetical protein